MNDHHKNDGQHLQLLSVFHFVLGGITALFGFMPIFHLALGVLMATGVVTHEPNERAGLLVVGVMIAVFAAAAMVCIWALAVLMVIVGWKLKQRRAWMFCVVAAAVECLMMPLGTILGVFTIVVLMRPEVKATFGRAA